MESSEQPLVSIVTPAMNRRDMLLRCLQSVELQDYERIEHIVIDGGSTDGTREMLETWRGRRLKAWISERDGGMYEAVNKGLSMAGGTVLAYLNSDDMYFSWTVRTAVNALQAGSDVVFGDLMVLRSGTGLSRCYVQLYPAFDYTYYLWVQAIGQPTVFWTSRVQDAVGPFDTSYRLIADCDHWLAMWEAGFSITKVDEVLAVQLDHDETLRATRETMLRAEFEALRRQRGGGTKPRALVVRNVLRKAWWRRQVFCLFKQLEAVEPTRWPEFARFMRSNEIRVNSVYPWLFLLPQFLRIAARSREMFDSERLVSTLMDEYGIA